MRTMVDVAEYDAGTSPECAAEIDELAGALRALLDAPAPWPARTVEEVRRQMHELSGRPLPRESPESAIVTTAARRVARDVIGLLPEATAA
jgi:hypothetical protein